MNFLIFVLDSVCSSSSLSPSRFAPLFFVLVRASRASRAGTTRVGEVRVVHGPRSWHVVLARHDTASLSCPLVSWQIVSCLVVFVSCSVVRPIWTSIALTHQRREGGRGVGAGPPLSSAATNTLLRGGVLPQARFKEGGGAEGQGCKSQRRGTVVRLPAATGRGWRPACGSACLALAPHPWPLLRASHRPPL
jgi:hypothetical protein